MTSDQNKYTCIDNTGTEVSTISEECANQLALDIYEKLSHQKCYKVVKKSRNYKLKKKLKRLENRFDSFDDDIYEIMRGIDDIKKCLSITKSLNESKTPPESNSSDEDDIEYHAL